MGSAASLEILPDTLDATQCRELIGDKFDQAAFDAAAKDGKVTKEQVIEAMSANDAGSAAAAAEGT